MSIPYKTVAFKTLGCKLNFAETSTLARDFESKGFAQVNSNDIADIYVINTCSVTDNADKKAKVLDNTGSWKGSIVPVSFALFCFRLL